MSHPRDKRPFCATQEKGELLGAFPSSWAEDSHLAMRGLSLGANEQMFGTLLNTSISQEIGNLGLWKVALPLAGGWNEMLFKGPFIPNHSRIL